MEVENNCYIQKCGNIKLKVTVGFFKWFFLEVGVTEYKEQLKTNIPITSPQSLLSDVATGI